jgi:hypothetical protein
MTEKIKVKLLKEKIFNSIPEITHESGWKFGEFEIKSAIDRTYNETKKVFLDKIKDLEMDLCSRPKEASGCKICKNCKIIEEVFA